MPWNRTQILAAAAPRGGALLIHGLTDSPYSMRAIAERLNANGFYTVSLRMQGHGTVPGGLTNTTWEDWSAAVRMGARHVRDRIGPTGRSSSSATRMAVVDHRTPSTPSRTRRCRRRRN